MSLSRIYLRRESGGKVILPYTVQFFRKSRLGEYVPYIVNAGTEVDYTVDRERDGSVKLQLTTRVGSATVTATIGADHMSELRSDGWDV